MEFLREYPLAIAFAALVIGLLLYLLLRPRQRVKLSDQSPVRPHMVQSDSPREANDVASAGAAATSDVGGEIIDAPVHEHLTTGPGEADEFERMKGVGPKFAQLLQARGFSRYEQIARLNDDEAERLDEALGPFRGRLKRDRVIEQARFLARGDEDGFQQTFGKL